MFKALFDHVRSVWKFWWLVAVGIVATAWGVVEMVTASPRPWLWVAIALACFNIAQFLAWKDRIDKSPLSEKYIEGASINIGGIDGKDIKGRTFEHCTINGPAVVGLFNSSLSYCGFSGGPEVTFIEVESGKAVIGIIPLVDCVFRRCTFNNVAVMGTKEMIQTLKGGFLVAQR